ncbi:MAG: OmpA family protein [Alphaproteobacteria bacterium]
MSLSKKIFSLFVGSFLITACAEDAKFPELRASQDVSEDKIYETSEVQETQKEELVSVDMSKGLSDVSVTDNGTVIIAAVHPSNTPVEKQLSEDKPLKIKPILKKKTDGNIKDPILKSNRSPSSIKLYDVETEVSQEANGTKSVEFDSSVLAEVSYAEPVAHSSEPYKIETFYFNNGSSQIKNEDRSKIRKIVKLAKEKKATVYVLGYSSSRTGDTDYVTHKMANFKISLARAESVSDALINSGLKSDKVLVEALSDARPAYLEVMPEGERLNRRVEVYIGY